MLSCLPEASRALGAWHTSALWCLVGAHSPLLPVNVSPALGPEGQVVPVTPQEGAVSL